MGDRCYSEVTCRPRDARKFEAIGYVKEEGRLNPLSVVMVDEQANYGNHEELLAVLNAVFIARNGPGDDYGASVYISDGRQTMTMNRVEAGLEVSILETPDLSIGGLRDLPEFLLLSARVDIKLGKFIRQCPYCACRLEPGQNLCTCERLVTTEELAKHYLTRMRAKVKALKRLIKAAERLGFKVFA